MALPKTSVALLILVVACAAAIEESHVEIKSDVPKLRDNVIKPVIILSNHNTTTPIPTTTQRPSSTSISPPTPTSSIAPNTTTVQPITTVSPNASTTTTSPSTTHSPNTTTTSTPVPPTTQSPNVTTTVPPTPAPAPAPGRHWDAPSFFGGMVLAFGIVAVGFVGYRFFYLGRGGAYHTL